MIIPNLRHRWQKIRTSFWFVPGMIVLCAVALAAVMIAVDASVELHVDKKFPLVFGAGAAGSRSLLTAVASSMITVAGVVFSITIVALSLTSSQYTSRVLRNFMSDSMNQIVLGVFVGIFAYCLVVLRTIRDGDEGAFVPSFAVLVGLALAFVGIGFLIYFIHHISLSIQASSIIAAVARETIVAVDHLFPKGLAEGAESDGADDGVAAKDRADLSAESGASTWSVIRSLKTGYIESIDGDALLALARKHDTVVRMERGIGEFLVEGVPLASLAMVADEATCAALNKVYVISRHRTVQQDAAFGIRQIVDIALKALSPGVNDTTTAVMCVDYLSAILTRLTTRGIAPTHRFEDGALRVIARGPTFETLLAEACDQLRQSADGNVAVLTRQLEALAVIAGQTTSHGRRQALRQQGDLSLAVARRTIPAPHDLAGVEAAFAHLSRALAS